MTRFLAAGSFPLADWGAGFRWRGFLATRLGRDLKVTFGQTHKPPLHCGLQHVGAESVSSVLSARRGVAFAAGLEIAAGFHWPAGTALVLVVEPGSVGNSSTTWGVCFAASGAQAGPRWRALRYLFANLFWAGAGVGCVLGGCAVVLP